MDNSQLLKGILEGCVLSIISKGEIYGYEILSKLNNEGFHNLMEGTLYPVLLRLEKKGYVTCRKAKSPLGPTRKYYSISEMGELWLIEFQEKYKYITSCAQRVIFTEENNDGGKADEK